MDEKKKNEHLEETDENLTDKEMDDVLGGYAVERPDPVQWTPRPSPAPWPYRP